MLRLDVEPRVGYLYANVSGQFTLSSARAIFSQLLAQATRYGRPRIFMDCTRVVGEMGSDERMAYGTFIAEEQRRVAGQFSEPLKVAILALPPVMDYGRLTQTAANNRGAQMRASDNRQELMSWLGV